MTEQNEHIDLAKTALLVIDVQMAFVHFDAEGAARSTPLAESNIRRLLQKFRDAGGKIIHIHHHSHEPGSPFTAGLPGALVQMFARPAPGEATYIKHVNSAFIGTSLEGDLSRAGIEHLIVCGAEANKCVETTARMAGNLGFNTLYVSDGVWAYGSTGPDGREHGPDDVLSVTLSNMHGEFATVLSTEQALDLLNS
ncbi:MAG: isochorismatase family protein [Alphaproteobacteria bacterium]|jgi:nicotinamidase-related amidase|nr:isochorismatase family protein [Alphaproteobacteria bacterium]MDP6818354.1 isochorismatase family protein [Alphaproteobacteria bacterium]